MNALAKPLPNNNLSVNFEAHRNESAPAYLDGVIDKMVQLHEERGAGMFAFAAPHWRAGTSHVVGLVADELVQRYRCTVAVMPTVALRDNQPAHISQGFHERSPGVYVAASDEHQAATDCGLMCPAVEEFDFTLVDCPALLTSPHSLRWTNAARGVFLVVAAGVTHVNQIREAQRLLKVSASRLEGIVLNRRSYPIPKVLYQLL